MRRLIILAFGLTVVLCLTTQSNAKDNEKFVEEESDIKNAELNALLAADSSTGVHDNQSGRQARQFGFPFFGGGFRRGFGGFGRRFGGFGGFGRRFGGFGGFGGRRFFRRRRFFG